MNFHLKKAGYKKPVTNFSSDLKDGEAYAYLLNVLAPEHCTPATLDTKDPAERANLVLEHAEKMDCKRYLAPKDIVEGSSNLNLAFVAQIFHQRLEMMVFVRYRYICSMMAFFDFFLLNIYPVAQKHGHVSNQPEFDENEGRYKSYAHCNVATRDPCVGAACGRPDGSGFVSRDYRIRRPDDIQISRHERDCYDRDMLVLRISEKYGTDPSVGVSYGFFRFCPFPHHGFSQQSSSGGWLNEPSAANGLGGRYRCLAGGNTVVPHLHRSCTSGMSGTGKDEMGKILVHHNNIIYNNLPRKH
ncbi:hypothetical protein OSB04_007884 [Centaurea solstitialis]|uniref:Calponin-homology (CH) domain-containing protein n=1 Tax=Centaurea solstitialis TaxID=347529 RepID=A0AA38TKQ9_9ASTR|nr:hypothetical protein OSB04_007884 [Centaurea solstitialis]